MYTQTHIVDVLHTFHTLKIEVNTYCMYEQTTHILNIW